MDSFVLLSLPLFILAGALMETGGIAHRLVRLAVALVGWVRGGLGMAVVAAEYIFSGISGSTVADVSAVASTTIPGMVRAGYSRELAVAVVSSASAMGILVPPCLRMLVIGSVGSLSVAALFTAGFLPAVVMALVLMAYIWRTAGRMGIAAEPKPTLGELGTAFRQALIPLGMPAIIFGGILGGIMTPTEASVLAVLYAAVVGLFVYREIAWSALPAIIMNAAMITGAVGLLLGTAGVVSWFLTVQQMPAAMIRIMTVVPGSSVIFLFITAAIFIFFGAVIEGLPAVVILLPSLLPWPVGIDRPLRIVMWHGGLGFLAPTGRLLRLRDRGGVGGWETARCALRGGAAIGIVIISGSQNPILTASSSALSRCAHATPGSAA